MPAPLLFKRAVVGAKVEAVEGTAETLVAADFDIEAENIAIGPDLPFFPKEAVSPSLSKFIGTSGGPRLNRITFETEIRGSGTNTTPPSWGVLLRGCGLGETIGVSEVDYDPVSTGWETLTLAVNIDGVEFKIHGAMGTFRLTEISGEPGKIAWEFLGVYNEPTDVALPVVPSYDDQIAEAFVNATATLGGTAFLFKTLEVDIANVLTPREQPSALHGVFSVRITDRAPTFSIDPEMDVVATENFFNDLTTNVEQALQVIHGLTAGNIFELNAPAAQYEGLEPVDRDGILVLNASGRLNRNLAAGDDEMNIETS